MSTASSTIDHEEISHFSKDADQWWNIDGPFAPLHKLNPERILYIKEQLGDLKGKKILDIGCGGGLVCEPLARLGADVTGADADAQAIAVAKAHADEQGLKINYLNQPAEEINVQFDAVLALEIIEHVSDPQAFVKECARLVKPDGVVIFSTLNRTVKSFLGSIVAAEHILRWVPQGTHDWKKFIKPSELARMVRAAGLSESDLCGLHCNPVQDEFTLRRNAIDVNYFLSAAKVSG
jgi:2-polyprenyl-6-hydroxyphenyl methylase/3-demethylubiquinone-9 3-methyltransferase